MLCVSEVPKKSSVFDRLGTESAGGSKTVTVTGLGSLILNRSNSPLVIIIISFGQRECLIFRYFV